MLRVLCVQEISLNFSVRSFIAIVTRSDGRGDLLRVVQWISVSVMRNSKLLHCIEFHCALIRRTAHFYGKGSCRQNFWIPLRKRKRLNPNNVRSPITYLIPFVSWSSWAPSSSWLARTNCHRQTNSFRCCLCCWSYDCSVSLTDTDRRFRSFLSICLRHPLSEFLFSVYNPHDIYWVIWCKKNLFFTSRNWTFLANSQVSLFYNAKNFFCLSFFFSLYNWTFQLLYYGAQKNASSFVQR